MIAKYKIDNGVVRSPAGDWRWQWRWIIASDIENSLHVPTQQGTVFPALEEHCDTLQSNSYSVDPSNVYGHMIIL